MEFEKSCGNHQPKWFGLALQALVVLSQDRVQTCASGTLASHLKSEATLLRRILAILAKAGILETREGRDGGYRLTRDPHSLTLGEVYQALRVTDPLCHGMLETTGSHTFGVEMNSIFADLSSEIYQSLYQLLDKYTVGQIADRVNASDCRLDKTP
jgi:Rrf2 family transcriptional regulator, repressor of oqxAB